MEQVKTTGHSLKVEIEKLSGGFISNISGKRRIYKDAHDIDDEVGIGPLLDKTEDNEYILSIDLIPKDQYQEMHVCNNTAEIAPAQTIEELYAILSEEDKEKLIDMAYTSKLSVYEQAKLNGVIQPADKFNPEPAKPLVDTSKPIAITIDNCYTIAELQAVPWVEYDKKIPLSCGEKSKISGIVDSTMYNVWVKVKNGKFQWQSINTRIGMTILAKYYEKMSEKKVRKDDGLPPRNDKRLMEVVTEIELLCKGGLIKPNVLLKKVDQFKKLLIQD